MKSSSGRLRSEGACEVDNFEHCSILLGFEFRSFQNSDGEYTPNQMTHRARPFRSIVNEIRFRPTSTHIQLRVIFEHSDQQAGQSQVHLNKKVVR